MAGNIKKAVTGVFLLIFVIAMVLAIWLSSNRHTVVMSFRLPEVDSGATVISDVDVPAIGTPGAGGAGGTGTVAYSTEIVVQSAAGTAEMMFDNPASSGNSVVLHIMAGGREIGTTGLIPSGYGIRSLSGMNLGGIEPGRYPGVILVDHYDPDTGEMSMFQLSLDVTVVVM